MYVVSERAVFSDSLLYEHLGFEQLVQEPVATLVARRCGNDECLLVACHVWNACGLCWYDTCAYTHPEARTRANTQTHIQTFTCEHSIHVAENGSCKKILSWTESTMHKCLFDTLGTHAHLHAHLHTFSLSRPLSLLPPHAQNAQTQIHTKCTQMHNQMNTHTHAQTLTHAHTLFLSLSLSLSLSFSLPNTHTHKLSHTLLNSHAHAHAQTHPHAPRIYTNIDTLPHTKQINMHMPADIVSSLEFCSPLFSTGSDAGFNCPSITSSLIE